jgi:lipid II:glycine glycyltransferase (peptidoglycan interpeptide bridge formation enzyme)
MDLRPSLEQLRTGMKAHWKRELKVAEKNGLEVVEGSGDALFEAVIDIHREMVARKKFVEGNDINDFRRIQALLPENLKMRIMLCRSDAGLAYGLVCSAIGKTALYLFGATSTAGMKSRGSYFLHWRLLEQLKSTGITVYDLNGINPDRNPGTYKFKSDFGGDNCRDVSFLGRYDSESSGVSYGCVELAETARALYRTVKGHAKNATNASRLLGMILDASGPRRLE